MRILTETINEDSFEAKLTIYLQDNSPEIDPFRLRPMIVICPGGGYEKVSARESEPVALHFLSKGYQMAVLDYSVAPARYPISLRQLARSVKYLRENAEDFFVNRNKIIVMGFSAGGHLAATLGANWSRDIVADIAPAEILQPNALILSYPVITSGEFRHEGSFQALLGTDFENKKAAVSIEKLVTEKFPPTFVWHTVSDDSVSVKNSMLLTDALFEAEIPFESHFYNRGPHGLALGTIESQRNDEPHHILEDVQNWPQMADRWIKNLFTK